MDVPPPHLYQREARERGIPHRTVTRALRVTRAVERHGATPVLTLKHLSELTGASYPYLRDIIARRRDPYRSIDRPKRSGGRTRAISSPEPVLMDVQRWILRRILAACAPDNASFAYQGGRSIVDCASSHIGARWLVKLDIHDFFPSIREPRVFPIFLRLGYPRLLSLELTRLCTRVNGGPATRRFDRYRGTAPYDVHAVGRLPQGAPTSGALANLALQEVDRQLTAYASDESLVYTRYSDDIVLSSTDSFSRDRARTAVKRVTQALKDDGLSAHHAKTRIITPGARKIVLGLLVDDDRVRLLPEFKRRLEVHVRGVAKFGLPDHASHRSFDSILSMINHIDGCIAFAASVDKNYADALAKRWATVLRERGYPR